MPLFGGVGDRGAERFPDFVPWDADVGEAVVFGVGVGCVGPCNGTWVCRAVLASPVALVVAHGFLSFFCAASMKLVVARFFAAC